MRRLAAEFLGTFFLVFAGTGAIIANEVSGGAVTHVGVSLTFGLVVMAMIYAFGDVSGAHLNPAVTAAFWVSGRFAGRDVGAYVAAQLGGALAASGLLRVLHTTNARLGMTLPSGPVWQSLVLEVVLTAMLMVVILSVSRGPKEKGLLAGIAIGGVVALEALFAGPISGASMNPARSLAPALVTLNLEHAWVYVVAPMAGAIAAVGIARVALAEEQPRPSEKAAGGH